MISNLALPIIGQTMTVHSISTGKLVLAVALATSIFISACARAPRRAAPVDDLRRLVMAALSLYAVAVFASLSHHQVVAGAMYAAGILVCALAAWLSRGPGSDEPPDGGRPADEQPPPEPDGLPEFDWSSFERGFRAYSERQLEPAGRR